MEINEEGKISQNGFRSFLSKKPMWTFWIAYILLCGILFGISYTVPMVQPWGVPILMIIPVGMIWGISIYKKQQLKEK